MDFERDYILRLIQMMGDFMRRIAEKMDDLERGRMLDMECRKLCGMSMEAGASLAFESLREMLSPMPRYMLSELLYVKAMASSSLPIEEADQLLIKALRLLATLHTEARLCDLRAQRLDEIKAAVFMQLTAADLMDCARFFAQAERYDLMEDTLFQALARTSVQERVQTLDEAVSMLRRGAKATENALALCGMTADELRQAAHELETQTITSQDKQGVST